MQRIKRNLKDALLATNTLISDELLLIISSNNNMGRHLKEYHKGI